MWCNLFSQEVYNLVVERDKEQDPVSNTCTLLSAQIVVSFKNKLCISYIWTPSEHYVYKKRKQEQ